MGNILCCWFWKLSWRSGRLIEASNFTPDLKRLDSSVSSEWISSLALHARQKQLSSTKQTNSFIWLEQQHTVIMPHTLSSSQKLINYISSSTTQKQSVFFGHKQHFFQFHIFWFHNPPKFFGLSESCATSISCKFSFHLSKAQFKARSGEWSSEVVLVDCRQEETLFERIHFGQFSWDVFNDSN